MPSSASGQGAPRVALATGMRHGQSMSPRLQQAVRLLLMSAQEYEQALGELVLRNPFLTLDDIGRDPQAPGDTAVDAPPPAAEGAGPQASDESGARAEWDDAERWPDGAPVSHSGLDSAGAGAGDHAQARPGLRQHLLAQAAGLRVSERDRTLIHAIVGSLDDDGYLRCDLQEIGQWLDCDPPVLATELNTALRLVQSFEPEGVGARDLVECLLLQVDAKRPAQPDVVRRLISRHLEQLARGDTRAVARSAKLPVGQVAEAWTLIRQLNPCPGEGLETLHVQYVRPDAIAYRSCGQWQVRLNGAALPRISLNQSYADLFQQHRDAGHAELAAHLQEARWAVRNVQQRSATILAVAQAIVRRQQGFLDNGPLAMRPLALRDVAQELGIHESTVSRATNGKYLQTPNGPVELKDFFSRPMQVDGGGVCSAMAIRGLVQEIIAAEDITRPLSDVQIAERLARQGLQVARRTVTKYRQMLRLPSVEQRRGARPCSIDP